MGYVSGNNIKYLGIILQAGKYSSYVDNDCISISRLPFCVIASRVQGNFDEQSVMVGEKMIRTGRCWCVCNHFTGDFGGAYGKHAIEIGEEGRYGDRRPVVDIDGGVPGAGPRPLALRLLGRIGGAC